MRTHYTHTSCARITRIFENTKEGAKAYIISFIYIIITGTTVQSRCRVRRRVHRRIVSLRLPSSRCDYAAARLRVHRCRSRRRLLSSRCYDRCAAIVPPPRRRAFRCCAATTVASAATPSRPPSLRCRRVAALAVVALSRLSCRRVAALAVVAAAAASWRLPSSRLPSSHCHDRCAAASVAALAVVAPPLRLPLSRCHDCRVVFLPPLRCCACLRDISRHEYLISI